MWFDFSLVEVFTDRALGGGMAHAFRQRARFPGPAVYALPTAGRSAYRIVPNQFEPTLEGNPWKCPYRPGALVIV